MPAADGDAASSEPSVSADGRFVAFRSEASNLVFGDSNGTSDVFVRDRVTAQTTRVSVASNASQANGPSSQPSISAGGRYVAFTSEASDLVSGDSNGVADVFVRDLLAGDTARVSRSSAGAQANARSSEPAISADGRTVGFSSDASNLATGDSNAKADVFTYSFVGAQTQRVSVGAAGAEANGQSSEPSLSADGGHVAFRSAASNLVAGDSNAADDVFVRASSASVVGNPLAQTARVSVRSSGAQAAAASSQPSISADGRHVAFTADDRLDTADSNGTRDVYVRDRTLDATSWASRGTSGSHGNSHSPSISSEAGYVAFVSTSPLRAGDANGVADVYERELSTDFTTRLSVDDDRPEANAASDSPSLSGDGTYAAFSSQASNLTSDDANSAPDVLLHTWSVNSPVGVFPGQFQERSAGADSGAGCGPSPVPTADGAPKSDARASSFDPPALRRAGMRCDITSESKGLDKPQGGCGEGDLAANRSACRSDPVNTATGSYVAQVKDLALAGIGLPFELVRTYNSGDPTVGALGRGWTHSYEASLSVRDAGKVVVARGQSGQRLAFTRLPGGSYAPTPNGRATLARTAGGYELTRRDQLRYRFDPGGRLTELVDRNGRRLVLGYDAGGRLEKITDTVGRQVTLSYTDARLTQATLPDARKVSYAYTGGLLGSVTDVRGGITRYEYSGGRLSKAIDQNNHPQITNVYGPGGRIASQSDALGKQTTFSWDANGRAATLKDPRGGEWRDLYSTSYELLREEDPLGHRRSYAYDAQSNVVAGEDARGHTTEMSYDRDDNLLTRTDALGNSEKLTYNARNDPITHTNPRGLTTAYDYDGQGNLVKVTQPGGVVTALGRDPAGTGLVKSVTDPRGKTERYDHDGQGNLTAVTSPKGFRATFGYDASGRLTSEVDPRGNGSRANPADYRTTFAYDAADHPTAQTDPLGHQTKLTYDPAGKLKSTVDAKNRTTGYGYDAANRLTQVTAPDSTTTAYAYNETGQLISRTDAKNHTTRYGYDRAGRRESATSPAGRRFTYAYDAASNLTERADANGNTTNYEYDRLDRLAVIDYPSSSNEVAPRADPRDGVDVTRQGGTPDVSFGYDENSNRTLLRDGEGAETYAYDQLDRLSKLVRGARAFSYDYDAASNVTQRRYPDGRTVDYAYDDDGRLEQVISAAKTTAYSYDPAGQLTKTALPNGYEELRSHDRAGRLAEVKNQRGASVLSRFAYTRDEVGNPTSVQSPGQTTSYAYDAQDRLTEACYQASCPGAGDPFIRYAYDAVGNRTSETRPSGTTSYSHDADDQLTSKNAPSGTTSYDHDQNGNLTRAGARSYGYDVENRITSTSSGSDTTSYRYDGDGTRISSATAGEKTELVWDKNNELPQLIAEENEAGDPKRRYLRGHELISMSAGGQEHYYHRDGLGSTTDVTGEGANAEWSYRYEPYGAERQTDKLDAQAPENPVRFAGERLDEDSGLYHLRARDYDPQDGRFSATDPLAPGPERPYVSAYAYAHGCPTVFTDPSGLFPPDLTPAFVDKGIAAAGEGLGHLGEDLADGIVGGANFAWEHRGSLAAIGVGITCTAATAGTGALACAGAAGSLLAYQTTENAYREIQDPKGNEFWRDQVVNSASAFVGVVPAARMARPGVTALLPRSRLGNAALNGSGALPGTVLGVVQDQTRD